MIDTTEYLRRLKEAKDLEDYDTEKAHIDADNVLCDLLHNLGYTEIVEKYAEIYKWHA